MVHRCRHLCRTVKWYSHVFPTSVCGSSTSAASLTFYHTSIMKAAWSWYISVYINFELCTAYYHTHANVWESMELHTVYKKPYFLLQVTRQSVSVLQVTQESVSGTTSHVRCNEIEGSHMHYHHSTKLYRKKTSFVCCRWHCYSCCALVTIQTASNSWYFPV